MIWHRQQQTMATSIDNWRIKVKGADRIAVSSSGEARPRSTEHYELRATAPGGDYHLYREIDEHDSPDASTIGDGLQRLVVDLLPNDTENPRAT
jgi:hypothetical protein